MTALNRRARRRLWNVAAMGGAALCAAVALVPLLAVLGWLAAKGLPALDAAFFTQLPRPVGEEGGGMANAIAGSLVVLGIACAMAVPVGLGAAVYLAEYGRNRIGAAVRFICDVLTGVPSIAVGIYVYILMVLRSKEFSALAGGVALAIIMLPIIVRSAEEMLRLVPVSLREAALALGAPQWRMVLGVVLRTARSGLITGIMVALARAAGETAPLLFTAFNNRFWSLSLDQPIATLPVQIFTYAIAPFDDWHRQAWAGALVLVGMVLITSILAHLIGRQAGAGALGRTFSREQILERVWGHDYYGEARVVDVHIRHLREKVEDDPARSRLIKTVRGFGYRLERQGGSPAASGAPAARGEAGGAGRDPQT